uniref:Uncharacterized protein n=1 Tax=Romanomermis culicivorax TaxID=13658 RepID=A0A915JBA2_ROMCU
MDFAGAGISMPIDDEETRHSFVMDLISAAACPSPSPSPVFLDDDSMDSGYSGSCQGKIKVVRCIKISFFQMAQSYKLHRHRPEEFFLLVFFYLTNGVRFGVGFGDGWKEKKVGGNFCF